MLKPAESVIVRQPTQVGRNNVILTGHVVEATATKVKVELEDGERRSFPASQVTKASARDVNSFFSDREEIVQQFKRR